ncbi:MAG: preprotein translocase subunit SecY [Saprospiraceae bacterium]|jgi:preprotein translocase subunit SecY|nr:preprotein translocase subunit SecY [Saprospiraceae bacterium]
MKKFIQTIENIWSIQELREKILYTLALLLVYRFGSYVVLPGVIPSVLENLAQNRSATDLLGLINVFTGGAFNNASIFALGIMPYITASIIIQLLGFAVPYFQKLQQHEGESGRKKLNQYTRFLTVLIVLVQGGGYLAYIRNANAYDPNLSWQLFWLCNIIVLATGTVFCMWLGERITERGIGNGTSLIIMVGIIAKFPSAIAFELGKNPVLLVIELALFILVILATIALVQAVRKILIQFAKRMVGRDSSNMPVSGNRDYIPLKLVAAGVMPIIFAQAIMFLPATLLQYTANATGIGATSSLLRSLNDYTSATYNIIYFILIVVFTYVYTALLVNAQQYSEYLKRQNAFIPGVKPGLATADYIDTVTSKITLPGACALGLIAILPAFARALSINTSLAMFFGGTTLLILVGTVLDTLQQVDSQLLMRKYEGLVKDGKVEGRATASSLQSLTNY